jgi:hypothetical protein
MPLSAFTAFMALLPSANLQTILLSDLDESDIPLKIVMAVRRTFLQFEARQTAIIASSGLSHPIGWAALSSENISLFFFKSRETL